MAQKKTLYVVTDIETTWHYRPNSKNVDPETGEAKSLQFAFDVAWKIIDNTGRDYSRGSYVATDVFQHATPFFKEKLGYYMEDTYAHLITPKPFAFIRNEYNAQIKALAEKGHPIVVTAYNAYFDTSHLEETSQFFFNKPFFANNVNYLDTWHTWGMSVPYSYSKKTGFTQSGQFYATTAEAAYAYEANDPNFIERHIAWHDVEIESDILVKALKRSKASERVLVKDWTDLPAMCWRPINERLQEKYPIIEPKTIGEAGQQPLFTRERWYLEKLKREREEAENKAPETQLELAL